MREFAVCLKLKTKVRVDRLEYFIRSLHRMIGLSSSSNNNSHFNSEMCDTQEEKFLKKCKRREENHTKLTFLSQSNPVTGKMDWVAVNGDDYDYVQEIARSGYGDMLHDTDRNRKYYDAIRHTISLMRGQGKKVNVLDIGTGTGLLSMMAASSGADNITACEAFTPMARCAEKIIKENGFSERIKLVPKRSTEVLLEDDLKERANLLVTELFDTELIGEGAIPSYTDAHNRVMQEDCMAVPSIGIMYVQAVQSPLLKQWNSLQEIEIPNGSAPLSIPPEFGTCTGAPSLHDLQVDQLEGNLTFLSDPVEVFRFDFSKRNALKKSDHSVRKVKALADGSVDALVMWWDLEMEPTGQIVLSCAPCWTRPSEEEIPWRDHWMQAIYYPSSSLSVEKHSDINIYSSHDEYSLWFDIVQAERSRPVCSCGLHVTMSRNRLAQMNSPQRNHIFTSVLQKHASPTKTCLVISDGSMLPLIAARLGFKKIFYLDNNSATRKIIQQIVEYNGLERQVSFLNDDIENLTSSDFDNLQIDVVIAEPYFQGVHLPWQHLYFWYTLSSLQSRLSPEAVILPQSMTIKAMGVQFRDLHKIRAPVGMCEGFDISKFDELIEEASSSVDEDMEPQPLWEYPCRKLSNIGVLMSLDFTQRVEETKPAEEITRLDCISPGCLNGLTLWTEVKFDDGLVLNSGVIEEGPNAELSWDKTTKQGVYLFRKSTQWNTDDKMTVSTTFNPLNGDISFKLL